MRAKRLLVLAIFVAIAATACGSSSKGTASNTNPTTATNAPGGSSSGGSSATTTTIKVSGDSGSDFCDLARKDEKSVFNDNGLTGSSAADLKKLYENIGPAIAEIKSKAPDSLKGDFDTFSTAFDAMVKALSDANYDVTKISPTAFAGLEAPKFKAASDHIEAYLEQVCHVTTTT